MKTVRMLGIIVGSVLAAFVVPLAARAWLASPRPVEAPVMAAAWGPYTQQVSQNNLEGVTDEDGMHPYPALAVLSPTVCVAWSRQVGSGSEDYDPYHRVSSANGEEGEWDGPFDIQDISPTRETTRVDVAMDSGGGLHFVWSEYTLTPYSYTLYYSSTQISAIQIIAQSNDELATPAIAVYSNQRVHVVWSQGTNSIKYASKNLGEAWGSSITIIASAEMAIQPDIAVDGSGTAHVVWSEGNLGSADVFYKNSSSNWSTTPFEVSSGLSNDGRKPAIAVRGNNVYVVWCEFESYSRQWVHFRQSTNRGASDSWSSSKLISGDPLGAHADVSTYLCPTVAVDSNGKIHVAFNGLVSGENDEDIYYVSKTQDGSWRPRENVTNAIDGNHTTPAIATSGEYVHLIWAGPHLNPLQDNKYDVLYKRTGIVEEEVGGLYLPIIIKSR